MGVRPDTADGVASEEAIDYGTIENYLNKAVRCLNQARNEMECMYSDIKYVQELAKSCQNYLSDIIQAIGCDQEASA